MRLNLQHIGVRSTDALDSWIENQILNLQPRLQIDEASVRLVRHHQTSPPFQVQVHLVTPGPDLLAEAQDHTLRAAWSKVMTQLRNRITHRIEKRTQRKKARGQPAGQRPSNGSPAH
ncbi:MAG: HPF/RaiA family ribosome-associated protein [Verrucomicrobiales bacterium]|nr:HPF/RaiA family ribosome-associated protein [Verrucomicrobiales bacterium]